MTTQVNFKIEDKLKKSAVSKAKKQGIPFSTVLKRMTKAYVDGQIDVDIGVSYVPNAKTAKILLEASEDYRKGRNISPAFDNAKDMMAWLESDDS